MFTECWCGSETGMLAVSYTAKSAGSYIVSARYNNVHLARSPATVVASTANACPGLCEVNYYCVTQTSRCWW
jgi:hypothetical protein